MKITGKLFKKAKKLSNYKIAIDVYARLGRTKKMMELIAKKQELGNEIWEEIYKIFPYIKDNGNWAIDITTGEIEPSESK